MKNFKFVQTIIEDKLKSLNLDFSFADSSVFSDNDHRTYQLKLGKDNPEIHVYQVDGSCRINMLSKQGLHSTYRIYDFEFENNLKEMKYDSLKRSTEITNQMIEGFVEFF